MANPHAVLHVEDDFADAMLLQHALCDAGALDLELEVVRTLHDARFKLAKKNYDLIIADLRLPDSTDPNATVALIQKHAAGAPILVLTGSAGVDAEKIGSSVAVLDKNAYFHRRDDQKSLALLAKVRAAMEAEDDADALIL
jgi:DNA-binding NtrC family response regulator